MALTENFNSYTDGDLNGQGSWVETGGTLTFDIQGTTTQEGAKAVINNTGTNDTVYKTFTASAEDGQQFYARPDTGTSGMITYICISDNTNAVATIDHTAEADSTWHKYNVEWDANRGAGGQYRYKVDDGAWGAWTDGAQSFTTLGAITLRRGSGNPSYWDNFTTVAVTFHYASVSDTFSLTESISMIKGQQFSVSDTFSITESITNVVGVIISVVDNLLLSEDSVLSTVWTRVMKSVSTWTNRNKS